jgi:hypothetical protein
MKQDAYPNQTLVKKDMVDVITTALQLVFERFDTVETDMATKDDITRLENKLDSTIDTVDDHAMRLRALETPEPKFA